MTGRFKRSCQVVPKAHFAFHQLADTKLVIIRGLQRNINVGSAPACNLRKWMKTQHTHPHNLNSVKELWTDSLGLWFQDPVYPTSECFFVGVQTSRGLSADSHPHPVALLDPGCWVRKSLLPMTRSPISTCVPQSSVFRRYQKRGFLI